MGCFNYKRFFPAALDSLLREFSLPFTSHFASRFVPRAASRSLHFILVMGYTSRVYIATYMASEIFLKIYRDFCGMELPYSLSWKRNRASGHKFLAVRKEEASGIVRLSSEKKEKINKKK